MVTLAEALRGVPLFAGLTTAALESLAQRSRRREVESGQTLFLKGEQGTTLFVILSGTVSIQTSTSDGDVVHLAVRGPGEHFGEMSLIDGKPRMAGAITAEDCELLILERDEFQRCLRESPEIATAVMSTLADRLREAAEQHESRQELSVPGRLSELLLDLAESHGVDEANGGTRILLRLTQYDMADRIGASREAVNRALSGLRDTGAIRTDGRTIIVMDLPKLRRFSRR